MKKALGKGIDELLGEQKKSSPLDKLFAPRAKPKEKKKVDPFDAALGKVKAERKAVKAHREKISELAGDVAKLEKKVAKKAKKPKKHEPKPQIGLHHTHVAHRVIFVVTSMTWLPSGYGTKRHVTSFTTENEAHKHANELRAGKHGGKHGGVAGHGNVSVKRVSLS